MDNDNTTKRTQPQPGTPAMGVVQGVQATDVDAGGPIPLKTKEAIPSTEEISFFLEDIKEEEIKEPSLKRVRKEGGALSGGHSAFKRIRKEGEPSSDNAPSAEKIAAKAELKIPAVVDQIEEIDTLHEYRV
jgi:hypothetical protein